MRRAFARSIGGDVGRHDDFRDRARTRVLCDQPLGHRRHRRRGHSQAWASLGTLEDLFGLVGDFLGAPPLSDAQLAWAVDAAQEAGLPSQLTLFGRLTIADDTPAMTMHSADGQGIDHLFDWGPVLIGIYLDALAH